jgi:hypothetical protein
MELQGKMYVVTGSGNGIGRATALEMASRRAKVVISDANDETGQESVAQITDAGGEATYIHADMLADRSPSEASTGSRKWKSSMHPSSKPRRHTRVLSPGCPPKSSSISGGPRPRTGVSASGCRTPLRRSGPPIAPPERHTPSLVSLGVRMVSSAAL